MQAGREELPCPRLTISASIPADPKAEPDFKSLPARPGVLALEDGDGRTLLLAITANLRRMARSRMSNDRGDDADAGPTRRIDFRSVTRAVRALTVGSEFEGEWAYLQLARRRMAGTYRGTLDRWRGWFVHCDPEARFPRFTKTNHPGRDVDESRAGGVFLGPIPDKHAAGRYIDLLNSTFDLCRHYNILLQTPDATACAYKEIGRCPAPCDGSVTLAEYGAQVRQAIEFASTPIEQWRAEREQAMNGAAEQLEFESAQRWRRQLEDTAPAAKPKYAHVDLIERFRFVAAMPAESAGRARLFAVRGGWIAPVLDLPFESGNAELDEATRAMSSRLAGELPELTSQEAENIGLVCRHLFRPARAKRPGVFLRCPDGNLSAADLKSALGKLRRSTSADKETEPPIEEASLEG